MSLIKPLVLVPSEQLGGVGGLGDFRSRVFGFVAGFADEVILEFVVADFADRVSIGRLMAFAFLDWTVSDVAAGLPSILHRPRDMLLVIDLAIMKLALPILAEGGEQRGSFLVLAIARQPHRIDLLENRLDLLPESLLGRRR